MACALLISTAGQRDFYWDDHARIQRAAAKDAFKVHTTTDDPDAADIILFFEPDDPYLASDVRRHPYVKRYRDKVFVCDPSDRIVPFLPGIYASIERRQQDRTRTRSGSFPVVFDHNCIVFDETSRPELLYSFMGDARGIAVREALMQITHRRALVRDTGDDPANAPGCSDSEYDRFHRDFAAAVINSKFVLCPRGAGTSTFRLFETMKAGRVPVILSDDWVAPEGPDWPSFSIIVPERDTARVPAILEAREDDAFSMGRIARQQWEAWFSESAAFHRMVESCLDIQRCRRRSERVMQKLVLLQLLTPFHFRHKLVPGLRGLYRC